MLKDGQKKFRKRCNQFCNENIEADPNLSKTLAMVRKILYPLILQALVTTSVVTNTDNRLLVQGRSTQTLVHPS